MIQEDTLLRVTFKLRPEPEETAMPSCRNSPGRGTCGESLAIPTPGLQITFPPQDWGRVSEPVGLRIKSTSKIDD